MLKTNMCGKLNIKNIDENVILAGWVSRRRDHGGLTFIDLRDSSGIIQIVIKNQDLNLNEDEINRIRNEWVLIVEGRVVIRQKGTENSSMLTGNIEVQVKNITIANQSKTPPFPINEEINIEETNRMQYRYLDLRRSKMLSNIKLRHEIIHFIRNFLHDEEFIEIETPILNVATPEGARDYLVPSRVHPGKFYALPQSPQQWKQLLMVSGFEKYFQIARCFRDEDLRSDRQPEFTQLDIEMSFVEQDDILQLTENLMTAMVKKINPAFQFKNPFPVITYANSIEMYGTDKPDIRFNLPIRDLSAIFANTSIKIFQNILESKNRIRGISIPNGASLNKKQIQVFNDIAINLGAKGIASIKLEDSFESNSPSSKDISSLLKDYINDEELKHLIDTLESKSGDLILISGGDETLTSEILGAVRVEAASNMKLINEDQLGFCFVTEFPMFEFSESENRWTAMHHLFTMPYLSDIELIQDNPSKVRSHAYDLVCNGQEIGSGSIRIHESALLLQILEKLGFDKADAEKQFAHMLNAFDFGAPPHGGIAPGIDRIVAMLAKETDIREVIAFPKTKTAADLLTGAPSEIDQKFLDELKLKINLTDN
ncbi:MAG: aspartate--tRNA ligase [Dehalococcoidia bacterium]|nr:aspartate--tRNA ligase [Dehalococcoidia bacterium]